MKHCWPNSVSVKTNVKSSVNTAIKFCYQGPGDLALTPRPRPSADSDRIMEHYRIALDFNRATSFRAFFFL